MAALASTEFPASGMFRPGCPGQCVPVQGVGEGRGAGDSHLGWAFELDYHFIVSSKVLWWKEKVKSSVEVFHLEEKPRREFQFANFQSHYHRRGGGGGDCLSQSFLGTGSEEMY